jgi:hypothetical protein
VAAHRLGKPQGFEVFNAIKDSVNFTNIQSWDSEDWFVRRYPYTDAGAITVAAAKVGHLVKFNATRTEVLGAVGADDAALEGVIVDLPDNTDVPSGAAHKTVAVALRGSFDKNNVLYSDNTSPISAAGLARLNLVGIIVDPATPPGPFAP